jgi:hypothetical protein
MHLGELRCGGLLVSPGKIWVALCLGLEHTEQGKE